MRALSAAATWAALAGLGASGCLPTPEHRCSDAIACGAAGACVEGYCAFPVDVTACPSGLRFGDGAGPRAGTCVEAQLDAGVDDAPPPPPPYGRGVDRPLVIGAPPNDHTINTCAPLLRTAAGATTVEYDSPRIVRASYPGLQDFADDRLVIIWQTTGLAQAVAGDPSPFEPGDIGRYQLVRVVDADPTTLTLAEPLGFAVAAGAQVCRVPEVTTVTVANTGAMVATLRAPAWNGSAGGVLALLAADAVSVTGTGAGASASGRGGRGGAGTNQAGVMANCIAMTGPTTAGGGARKGEGVVPSSFALTGTVAATLGRGNVTSGGGGGGCTNAGGGGGGGAGAAGGRGGFQAALMASGSGLGGAPPVFDPRSHLLMGGGGGGGEGNDGQPGGGAAGGGVVLMRMARLACAVGAGPVRSQGFNGGNSTGVAPMVGDDGAGGGGGGGTIYVEAGAIDGCGFSVQGGAGGSTRADPLMPTLLRGPGGGGGGGRVLVRVANSATGVTYAVSGGGPGSVTDAMMTHGADSGRAGIRCGDGLLSAGEACDDGNLVRGDGCDQCVRE